MANLLRRGGRIARASGRISRFPPNPRPCLCCGGEPPVPCCNPPTLCGSEWEVCIKEFEIVVRDITTISVFRFDQNTQGPEANPYRTYNVISERSIRMRGGPYRIQNNPNDPGQLGRCVITAQIPVRDTITERYELVYGPATGDCGSVPQSTQTTRDYCLDVVYRCLPPESGVNTPPRLEWPQVDRFGLDEIYGTQVLTGQGGCFGSTEQGTTTITRSSVWNSGGLGTSRLEFDETRTSPLQSFQISPACCGRFRSDGTTTIRYEYNVVSTRDCDGYPFDDPCTGEFPTECQGPEQYRIAFRCGRPGDPPLLIPIENVRGCGVVEFAGGCYLVKQNSPTVSRPDLNDYVGVSNAYIDQFWLVRSCCECEPTCLGGPIPPGVCWNGGRRPPAGGEWVPNQAFVVDGDCCCNPDDIIHIEEITSTLHFGNLGTFVRRCSPTSVVRGSRWDLPFNEVLTYDTGEELPPFRDVFRQIGEFDCSAGPWMGGVLNEQGFGPPALEVPESFVGLHYPHGLTDGGVRPPPCPISADGTEGVENGTIWFSKQVAVTCTLFQYDGYWRWGPLGTTLPGDPAGPGQLLPENYVVHKLRLRITPRSLSTPECNGGCEQADGLTPPVAGPGRPGTEFDSPLDIRDIIGGP